jgi:uncharacterized protein (TIGR02246 family)
MNSFSMVRRVQILLVAVAAAGALTVLFTSTPARAADMDANAQALVKLDDEWSKAAATKDAGRVASFYAEDGIAYPPGEPAAVGREAAKKVWAEYFADPSFTISWKTAHAEIAGSGDIGYTAGTYDASFKGPDGKPASEKGKYLTAWKKQADGTWKATHDMWNADAQ